MRRAGQTGVADDPRPALAMVSVREVWARVGGHSAICDAHGVLVGLSQLDGEPTYVWAVGVCAAAGACALG